jgi:uncharacterized protein (TIGR02271 family)
MPDTTMKDWIDHDLVDEDGDKIGRITEVYFDRETGRAEWVTVSTGLFGSRVSFVPLQGLEADADVLVSPWHKDKVKDAPNVEADGELSDAEEERLYRHYGLEYGATGQTKKGKADRASNDDAMTRSEEEMRVDKRSKQVGRARLRKWVETEHQTVTVPVRKEKVRLEREPISDANIDASTSGPDISEAEHEIVLNEERAVVDTEVVPKERVRLEKDVDVTDEKVEADLRKEHIDLDEDADLRTRR